MSEERFERVLRLAQRTFGARAAVFVAVEGGEPRIKAAAGDPAGLAAAGSAPVTGPDGSVIGSLDVLDRGQRELDLEQKRALRDLAGMLSEELARATEPVDEMSRLLERLRLDPAHVSSLRRFRLAFGALILLLVVVTAFSMRLAGRMSSEADALETALGASLPAAAAQPLAGLRSTSSFFRKAVGARGVLALACLVSILLLLDRQLESGLVSRAEIELERARLRSVIDGLGEGVLVADARGRFTLFNPAAERLLGVNQQGSGPLEVSLFLPDERPCPPERHPIALATAGRTVRDAEFIARSSGRPGGVPLLVTATPIRAFDGSAAGAVLVLREAGPADWALRAKLKRS